MSEKRKDEEEPKLIVADKRRIKSADDTCDDASVADLERIPSFVSKLEEEARRNDERLKEYIAAHKEKMGEMDALRKRLEADAERQAAIRFGSLMGELLPVVDDVDRAIEIAQNNNPDDPLLVGVKMMRAGLMKALVKQGLEEIDLTGRPFDPESAQAVGTTPVATDEEDNTVVEQMAPGYRFMGRVLRHALVRVGQKQ
jgi:molecular chaperone GrpE